MAAAISVKAPIIGAILRWARESIGLAPERAAKRANVSVDNYKKWELGEAPINKSGRLGKSIQIKVSN